MPVEILPDLSDTQFHSGTTLDGLPFEFTAFFEVGAPEGAPPSYVGGTFSSRDGGGTFDIERLPDGTYLNTDSARIGKRPEDVMPWVVAEAGW